MVIAARPISSGASSDTRRHFRDLIERDALIWLGGRQRLSGALYLRIVWFHKRPTGQDTDNIAKRISDALIGVVYEDDNPVVKYLVERILYERGVTIFSNDISSPIYKKLVGLLGQEKEHIVYIEVSQVTSRDFSFGPFAGRWSTTMSMAAAYLEAEKLDQLAAEFRQAGFRVHLKMVKAMRRATISLPSKVIARLRSRLLRVRVCATMRSPIK